MSQTKLVTVLLAFAVVMCSGYASLAAQEKVNSPQAREAELLQKVEGAKFVDSHTPESLGLKPGALAFDEIFEIRDRALHVTFKIYYIRSGSVYGHREPGEYVGETIPYRDGAFTQTLYNGDRAVIRIGSDAQALIRENKFGYKSEIPRQ